jgi:hypothetical protein
MLMMLLIQVVLYKVQCVSLYRSSLDSLVWRSGDREVSALNLLISVLNAGIELKRGSRSDPTLHRMEGGRMPGASGR